MASGNGIQWLMELDAKLEGARAMVKELSNAEKAADGADKALKKVEGHSFAGMAKEVFKAELAMRALEKGAELAWDGVKKLGEKMWESLNIAAGSERTGKAFRNMLGEDQGKETLEYLEKFSNLSEFTGGAVKGMSMELLRAGLRGADFRNALALATDVAAQAPDKMEGMQEAISSLSRIALVGKVDARSLRGLRLNPHEVAEQMSKDLGLSKETIKKQLETGALDGTKAMQSVFTVMERKTGKQLGGLGLEMASGMQSRLEKLKDIPEEMAKNLKNTQGFKDIEDALGGFLDKVAPRLTESSGILGTILDKVGEKAKNIDWDAVLLKVDDIVEKTKSWIEPLETVAGWVGWIADKIISLPKFGEGVGDWAAKQVHPELAGSEHPFWHKMNEAAEFISNPMGKIARMAAGGLSAGVDAMSAANEKAGGKMIANVDRGARDAAEIHSPSRLFARHGEMISEGLAVGMESGSSRVASASASMMPAPSASGLGSAGSGGFNAGGVTVNVSVEVAGGSSSSAGEIAQEIQAILPSALLGALEQMAVQAGVA